MTTAPETVQAAVPPLTTPERWLLAVAGVLGVGVGGTGFALSFDTVTAAAIRWGFAVPQMLPAAIDTAIPAFTIVNLLLIRKDIPLAWVRWVPWALTLVTCWLNIDAGHGVSAKLAHGTMPLLWVVLSEVAAHVYASHIGAVTGRRMEKIRRSRWILAPISTFALWRRMTLWELTSYTDALALERARLLARADLRETYGQGRYSRGWRRRTPRRTRVLLKLGDLDPAGQTEPPAPPALPADREQEEKVPRKPAARKRAAAKPARPARTFEQLLAEARTATAGWPIEGLTAEPIMNAVHCSARNSRLLREALRDERAADGRPLHAVDGDDQAEGAAA
ncbi:DUF2637 domain-containing protein [Streptomyces sp. NBC_01262]|uniref:DUF2637 domain-containing protein n=1 Tax=Streptomyces sp. NBC_01262 TaxID=2903803 RepID=UPI002E35AAC4|nr:DUF2637 domain-containing protein [Streptomyces sp. NBC_01262]